MALVGSEKSYSGIFLLISHLLLALALYSLYDEGVVRRPWKDYQAEFNELQYRLAEREYADIAAKNRESGTDKEIEKLELELEQAEIARESDAYGDLAAGLKKMRIAYDDDELDVKFDKSVLDSLFYEYKHALQTGHDYAAKQKAYEDLFAKIKEKTLQLAEKKAEIAKVEGRLKVYDDKVKNLSKKIEELNKPLAEAQAKLDAIAFRPVEIKQIVVDDFGKGGNIYWGRVDRCMTCHVSADRPGFEDVTKAFGLTVVKDDAELAKALKEKPEMRDRLVTESKRDYLQTVYGTHPRSQELLAKHPVEQYGCTSCHGGDGRGVIIKGKVFGHGDKAHAFHHHTIEPLLRGPQMESNCLACHGGAINLAGAKNLSKGAELFVQLGCQNCHAVDGYDKLFRVGPELNKVGSKVRPGWLVDWLKNPYNYMPNTRMPNFNFKDDEVVAVASYLLANSSPHAVKNPAPAPGNAQNGEKLFQSVGCTGCHAADAAHETYAVRSRASNLSRVAAKVKNAAWVYDWIKNPKNYSEHARMPNLRLSDAEAADITAYLMSRSPAYAAEIEKRSGALARKVDPKNQELIAQGKSIINNKGCYSCHLMKGFEAGERIGPNLTAEALKEAVVEFDYGDAVKKGYTFTDEFGRKVAVTHMKEHGGEYAAVLHAEARQKLAKAGTDKGIDAVANVDHESWQSWIRNKLRYPASIYKHERAELRMPNFNLSDDELDALTVFLKAMTNRKVPYNYNAAMRERQQKIVTGQQLVAKNNCQGCHAISEFGGDIAAKIDKFDNAEFGSMTQHYPPELTHAGLKIRPEWLAEYLHDPSARYRPAVSVRMPTFGFSDGEVNTLIQYFAALSGVTPELRDTDYALDPKLVEAGKTLASNESGLACFACHILDGKKPGDDPSLWAPDWKQVASRLRYDFIPMWIQDPAKYQKHAIMPGFLNAPGTALPGILDGKEAAQLEALRAYLLSVGDKRRYKEMKNDVVAETRSAVPDVTPRAVETGGGVL